MSCFAKSDGPMSIHQSRYLGCQCSSARWSLGSFPRSTLLGIFAVRSMLISGPPPVELRTLRLPVQLEGAVLAGGVGAREDPVLPGRQAAVDLGVHGLRAAEAQGRLHPGERVRRQRHALLDGDAQLVLPVDL